MNSLKSSGVIIPNTSPLFVADIGIVDYRSTCLENFMSWYTVPYERFHICEYFGSNFASGTH